MNTGVRIGIIAGLIGFAIAIAAVVVTTGTDAVWIMALMLFFFGGMFLLFYKIFFRHILNAQRLNKTGLPGKGKILEVLDTGVTINKSPMVKLVLEVKNSFGQTYTAEARALISRLNPRAFVPGMEVLLKIDPKNEKNIAIDTSGEKMKVQPTSMSFNTTAMAAEVQTLEAEQASVRISGRAARAIVKEYNWLGLYVNGNNPYVELSIEVLPENSSSFSAKTKGVIAEALVSKFQPGQEIRVRYDYYDNSKVVIDHSV